MSSRTRNADRNVRQSQLYSIICEFSCTARYLSESSPNCWLACLSDSDSVRGSLCVTVSVMHDVLCLSSRAFTSILLDVYGRILRAASRLFVDTRGNWKRRLSGAPTGMSWRANMGRVLELRLLFCPSSASSAGMRYGASPRPSLPRRISLLGRSPAAANPRELALAQLNLIVARCPDHSR